uniref:Uncharacterized protein n=1 Tax=Oryza sativa subsp. japonica TaxID=39947 RepID=Q6YPB9_ORYSJ|nr:hypothetical protein [Oryza sativa Japonica Group]
MGFKTPQLILESMVRFARIWRRNGSRFARERERKEAGREEDDAPGRRVPRGARGHRACDAREGGAAREAGWGGLGRAAGPRGEEGEVARGEREEGGSWAGRGREGPREGGREGEGEKEREEERTLAAGREREGEDFGPDLAQREREGRDKSTPLTRISSPRFEEASKKIGWAVFSSWLTSYAPSSITNLPNKTSPLWTTWPDPLLQMESSLHLTCPWLNL